jgi:hypothetical protein
MSCCHIHGCSSRTQVFLCLGTRPPSRGHTYVRVVQCTDCLGMFASVSLSLQAARNVLRRIHCGVRRVPNHHYRWQRFLVGRALHPIILCHSNGYYTQPAGETARNAETGFAIKSKTSGLFVADPIRPILPSSLASACLGDKAGAASLPQGGLSL